MKNWNVVQFLHVEQSWPVLPGGQTQSPVCGSHVASGWHEQRIKHPRPWKPGGHSVQNMTFIGSCFISHTSLLRHIFQLMVRIFTTELHYNGFVSWISVKLKLTILAEVPHEAWFTVTHTSLFVAGASVLTVRTRWLALQSPESIRAFWGASSIFQIIWGVSHFLYKAPKPLMLEIFGGGTVLCDKFALQQVSHWFTLEKNQRTKTSWWFSGLQIMSVSSHHHIFQSTHN